jgi:outer membrane protein
MVMASFAVAANVQAQEKLRVGIVDARKVLTESKAGQQNRAELDKMVKERREKLSKEDTAIKALYEKLEKDKLMLNDKQKEQKQKEIEDRFSALKKMQQEAQQEVGKREHEFTVKLVAVLREVVAGVAKQEKLAMVISKNQDSIVWVEEEVDITDKVLKAFDAKPAK